MTCFSKHLTGRNQLKRVPLEIIRNHLYTYLACLYVCLVSNKRQNGPNFVWDLT